MIAAHATELVASRSQSFLSIGRWLILSAD
jgi:hypothetical protein